jgi:hypothetical protein
MSIIFVRRSIKQRVNTFFLADGDYEQEKWNTRNRRLWSRSMGVKVKDQDENQYRSEDTLDSVFDTTGRRTPHPIDPLARRHPRTASSRQSGYGRQYSRQVSGYFPILSGLCFSQKFIGFYRVRGYFSVLSLS